MNFIEKTITTLAEGRMKKDLESKIEKACECDGGASLDMNDHEKSCPAYEILKNA